MNIRSVSSWIVWLRKWNTLGQCLALCAALALLTLCGSLLHINLLMASFLYLLLVLFAASLYGFWQASFTSFLAVVLLDYFFTPPLYTFQIAEVQDWAALVAFEVTALVVSTLSAKELRNAHEAAIHRTGMEQLYELSRSSMLLDMTQPPGTQLVVLIQRIFDTQAIALFDITLDRQDRMGEWGEDEQNLAKDYFLHDAQKEEEPPSQHASSPQTSYRILKAGLGPVGALVLRGELNPLVTDALASLASLAMERHQSFEKESRAENIKQGEQLRVAVLDSLAHEFKTPLTAVQTTSSGLLELGGLTELQFEMVSLIDDEISRMNKLCTRLLQTAKLEAKQVGLQTDLVNLEELISEVIASHRSSNKPDRVRIAVQDPDLSVRVDRGLLAMILTQYIDNALKYSTPGTRIEVDARKSHAEVLISVKNFGPSIRIEDRERIFERFYRAPDARDDVAGTGIGLSVVKKAAEAHHGHVWVISDEKDGTTFFLSLPEGARRQQ